MQAYQGYYPMIDIHNLKLLIYNRILKGTLREFLKPKGLASPGKHPDMNFFKFHVRSVSSDWILSEASNYNDCFNYIRNKNWTSNIITSE